MASKQTQEELREDIIHAVNVLINQARDGEYTSAKHMKLYGKFSRMVKKLEFTEPEIDWEDLK